MEDDRHDTYESVFTNAKAGMHDLTLEDRDRIKRTIQELSKNSKHHANEQRKAAQAEQRIMSLKEKASKVIPAELSKLQKIMNGRMAELEATRDLSRTWLHVDMDAFFASCEELVNPKLRDLPMAVGGIDMISTANYHARKFGVRSAMPGFIGKALCPQLVFVPCNFDLYSKFSSMTRAIFRDYDPAFEAFSLDEASLDLTDYCLTAGLSAAQVAEEIRRRVRDETKLTCSCGVAANKMLSKICSDLHKPDGQFILESSRSAIIAFVESLPVRKIPGVGRVTEQLLGAFDVKTCGDVIRNIAVLSSVMTPALLDFALVSSMGLGQTKHSPPLPENEISRKGISCERTFKSMSSSKELESMASYLVEHLVDDMDEELIEGKTVTLKLKLESFELRTRSSTLSGHASSVGEILPTVLKLLRAELPVCARLMGVRMSNLRKRGANHFVVESSAFARFFKAPQPESKATASGEAGGSDAGRHSWRQKPVRTEGASTLNRVDARGRQTNAGDDNDDNSAICGESDHRADTGRQMENCKDRDDAASSKHDWVLYSDLATHPMSDAIAVPSTSGPEQQWRRGPALWTCRACTFAENSVLWLRCTVCDTLKGGSFSVLSNNEVSSLIAPRAPRDDRQATVSMAKKQKKLDSKPGIVKIDSFFRH